MAEVILTGLTKRFGDVVAVDGLDLHIAAGEFFALLGPSGCGKTTTLRMIAGLEDPDQGRIAIGGADVTHLPPHRRELGMVFQSYALFPHLSAAANVAYGLASRGVPRAERRRRAQAALDKVALGGLGARRVTELSGGQQQRVALARAMVIEPRVLLLDEPLSNLDVQLRAETRTELRRLQREVGITTVYVTHDQEEAFALSDRVAVMHGGRLQQVGPPLELYGRPINQFVASFLGRANLVAVEMVAPGSAKLPTGEVIAVVGEAPAGEQRTLCLRPEALRLGDGPGVLGVVQKVTFQGAAFEYHVEVGGTTWTVVEANLGRPPREPGAEVGIEGVGGAVVLGQTPATPSLPRRGQGEVPSA
ncbi:MAG: ABC transporter ATP-binding protein [Armatimonadetes bacterium]|nr:ABC transporter ATP-binding protein [Armatimonadota bacterium]